MRRQEKIGRGGISGRMRRVNRKRKGHRPDEASRGV